MALASINGWSFGRLLGFLDPVQKGFVTFGDFSNFLGPLPTNDPFTLQEYLLSLSDHKGQVSLPQLRKFLAPKYVSNLVSEPDRLSEPKNDLKNGLKELILLDLKLWEESKKLKNNLKNSSESLSAKRLFELIVPKSKTTMTFRDLNQFLVSNGFEKISKGDWEALMLRAEVPLSQPNNEMLFHQFQDLFLKDIQWNSTPDASRIRMSWSVSPIKSQKRRASFIESSPNLQRNKLSGHERKRNSSENLKTFETPTRETRKDSDFSEGSYRRSLEEFLGIERKEPILDVENQLDTKETPAKATWNAKEAFIRTFGQSMGNEQVKESLSDEGKGRKSKRIPGALRKNRKSKKGKEGKKIENETNAGTENFQGNLKDSIREMLDGIFGSFEENLKQNEVFRDFEAGEITKSIKRKLMERPWSDQKGYRAVRRKETPCKRV